MDFKRITHELTGAGPYRHALFYTFPGGLRFELSEGDSPLDLMLTALHRATVIARDVFGTQDHVLVHMQRFVGASGFELRETLRELRLAGIAVPKVRAIWREADSDTDASDIGSWINCAFEVPAAKLQNLLWCALATDLGTVCPNPQCRVYLIQPASGILLHPYDDRGMDVICRDSTRLRPLYEKHHAWLLDYDRDAMERTFNPAC
ncbi:DUF3885 domain-containing protein [Alcaligenaceae bacterium SJ-26]|nr:DUF3885 domain-containing protein [Alcaligenaceae bacterium SJ-26]